MDKGTDRQNPCGVEPLEGRYMMDSTFGQAVREFVQSDSPLRRGPIIAHQGQAIFHNPGHAPPPPVVEHFLDAFTP